MITTLPGKLGHLDWADWVYGFWAAFITGGASAITSGIVVNLVDPAHFNAGTFAFYKIVGAMFVANGVLGGAAFLRQKPLPEMKKVEDMKERLTELTPPGQPDKVVEREVHKETKIVPVEKPEDKIVTP